MPSHTSNMDETLERDAFLSMPRLPAILYSTEAAWLLGFTADDIARLVALNLLRPLGRPGKADAKRFSRAYLLGLKEDVIWLEKSSRAIYSSRRTGEVPDRSSVEAPAPVPRPKPSKAGASGKQKAAFHQVELLPFIPPCEEGTKNAE